MIIMTSNIGSQLTLEMRGCDQRSYEQMRAQVLEALRRQFRPEFLNRVDEVVVFRALTEAELARIVDIQLDGLRRRLAERRITIAVTEVRQAAPGPCRLRSGVRCSPAQALVETVCRAALEGSGAWG